MAKRKTPKVSKPSKITNEQLGKLQKIIDIVNRAQMQIGVFQTNIHQLLHHVAGKNDELTLIKTDFEKEYGTSDVDIQTGKINYPENGKAN